MSNTNKYKKYCKNDLNILYKINNLIAEKHLLQPNTRILIAISGGQDSMCLIKILFQLQSTWNWQLGIVHCDHQWNTASKLQANYVSQIASMMELDYYQATTIHNVNSESSARYWRYFVIKKIAYFHHYQAMITAHTSSDRIETFMYNFLRGCGMTGLQSLTWKRFLLYKFFVNVASIFKNIELLFKINYKENIFNIEIKKDKYIPLVRPLLNTTRTQMRLLLNKWQFPVWSDPTNRSIKIYRNRIRHRLMPYIRLYFHPQIDQTISQWIELIHYDTIYLDKLAQYIIFTFEILVINKYDSIEYMAFPIAILHSLPIFLQRRIIQQFIEKRTHKTMFFNQIEHIRLKIFYQIDSSKSNIDIVLLHENNAILTTYISISLSNKIDIKLTHHFMMIKKIVSNKSKNSNEYI
jgi:tRNA(Ile)-lysidine synthase